MITLTFLIKHNIEPVVDALLCYSRIHNHYAYETIRLITSADL
jgi:hypothetical protein